MINYNHIIKTTRITQQMTQQTLAAGICSTSYLSKIEKNHVVPRRHILDALLKRLNINIELLNTSQEADFFEELYECYQKCVLLNSQQVAQEAWRYFNRFDLEFSTLSNFYECNLYLQRIAIIAKQPILEINEMTTAFTSVFDKLTVRNQFIYFVNCCHYNYTHRRNDDALFYLQKASRLMESTTLIEKWLIGDFHLLMSKIYHSLFQNSFALSHTMRALELFEQLNLHIPIIHCYLRLGISNNRSGFFDIANRALEKAHHLAIQHDHEELLGKILQNTGYNAALRGDSKAAIRYYKKSLHYKHTRLEHLMAIHSIVKEYSKANNVNQLQLWCEKAKKILHRSNLSSAVQKYVYHIKILEMHHKLIPYEEDFMKEAIHFFQKNADHLNVQKYSFILAKYYEQKNLFKEAALLFKRSSEAALTVQERTHWQDLS